MMASSVKRVFGGTGTGCTGEENAGGLFAEGWLIVPRRKPPDEQRMAHHKNVLPFG